MPDLNPPVALLSVKSYSDPALNNKIGDLLDAADLNFKAGSQVLVKPNLLMAHELSCTNPNIVAGACRWLLDKRVKIIVADSPAFGSAKSVAKAIGLTDALGPLNITVQNFSPPTQLTLQGPAGPFNLGVAPEALNCDAILSLPRVKAHSQMRITLAVKNCYGCICGARKALAHCRFGKNVDFFADCVTALWQALPPVAALADGIVAMSITGPRNGKPMALGLLGASNFAPALDAAIMKILNLPEAEIPLARALNRAGINSSTNNYPLKKPEEFNAAGFSAPQNLKAISFNPWVLARSLVKRLWLDRRGK